MFPKIIWSIKIVKYFTKSSDPTARLSDNQETLESLISKLLADSI